MGKETIRKGMLAALLDVGSIKRKKVEYLLHKQLIHSDLWTNSEVIGLTLSKELEWNTRSIVKRAWRDGKRVCVPKSIHQTRELHFYQIDDFDQVDVGYYNIEEPIPDKAARIDANEIDLMIVPGVVFTRQGYRIGFGGGYYDRFLTSFPNVTVSMAHSNQIVKDFPIEEHDLPVHYIVTEKEWIKCKEE